MTDENQQDDPLDAPQSEVPAGEVEAGAAATVADVSEPRRRPPLLGLAALVLALVACAFTAMAWFSRQNAVDPAAAVQPRIDELDDRSAANRDDLARIDKQMTALQAADKDATQKLDAYDRNLDNRLAPLEGIPGRLSALESSLSSLQGISSGVRDKWLLAEAEYYMEIANARLQLAGDPTLALIALQLADERIARLADPSLTDVRRALADELQTLGELEAPDIEGTALTLTSLAGAVASLPLKTDINVPDNERTAADVELTGMDRALASLKTAFSKAVSVRRTDQPVKPLLAPDAAYFLKSNLTLQLQAARLALLRGEQSIYEQSLGEASAWLSEYYDTERTPVQSALDTIDELRKAEFTVATPDISRSLTLLRQYTALKTQERRDAPPRDDDAATDSAQ